VAADGTPFWAHGWWDQITSKSYVAVWKGNPKRFAPYVELPLPPGAATGLADLNLIWNPKTYRWLYVGLYQKEIWYGYSTDSLGSAWLGPRKVLALGASAP
jgi:hypothetical protein